MLRPPRSTTRLAAITHGLPCLMMLAAGCAAEAPTLAVGSASAPLLIPAGGCDVSEPTWIAVHIDPGPCPPVPGWAGSVLFPGSGGALARFCRYTGGAPVDLISEPTLTDAAPDCGVVAPQGNLADASGPVWAAGHAARLDLPPAMGGPATVAVLDTAGPAGSRSPHGPAMVALAEQSSGGAAVVPRVALPRVGDGTTDWAGGGHFGSPAELALAIVDAAAMPGPLVINLSLGWAPVAPLDDGSMPANHLDLLSAQASGVAAPVRAVHAALLAAVCEGALVVVAAGNDPIGGGETGALLPAAWAGLAAPDAAECDGLGLDGPGSQTPGRGLVEAVGGVNLADAPLTNGRPGSRPRLVAPAEHAAVESGAHWNVFSGTSAAAAAVSGAAAAVWSRDPGAPAGAVADTIYAGAVDLSPGLGLAEQCGPASCAAVRRLSVCGAVARVDPGLSCAAPPAFDPGTLATARAQLPAGAGAVLSPVSGYDDGCGDPQGDCPLPFLEPPAAPWPAVAPQPEWPGCPSCSLAVASGTLVLEIDDDSPDLYEPVLSVSTSSGTKHYPLGSQLAVLVGGQTAKMPGLALPAGVKSAWMTFIVQGKTGPLAKGNPISLR